MALLYYLHFVFLAALAAGVAGLFWLAWVHDRGSPLRTRRHPDRSRGPGWRRAARGGADAPGARTADQ